MIILHHKSCIIMFSWGYYDQTSINITESQPQTENKYNSIKCGPF